VKAGYEHNFNPKYVEVSFSNTCNFKCSYCGPQYSSKWVEEINQFGPYKTSTRFNDIELFKKEGTMPYLASDHNPYVEAFWKWWPEMYQDLHTFRITGGEPLLSKDTFKLLDYIIETPTPNKKLSLCINSNLGIPEKLFNDFVDRIEKILDKELVHEFIIFTSCDTHGEQADYIRHGFDYKLFHERVDYLLDKFKTITIDVMSTYNALSVPGYKKLIEDVIILKERHHNPYRYWGSALLLDSSYLRWPNHQTVKILDKSWVNEIDEQAKLADFYEQMRTGDDGYGFTDIEINKIKRIKDWFLTDEPDESLSKTRRDFYKFITEHDKRRNTDFVKVFPELEEFLQKCRTA
jgi:MoaA/NifB/PqqE/SkfB family radical SAM enzyme